MGRSHRLTRCIPRAGLVAALVALVSGAVVAQARAAAEQPRQPTSGPGGSDYAHAGFRVTAGGSGHDAWYVFEPTKPQPVSAPLAVITHGYYEFSGYGSKAALIGHTVRKGNVVIYPRWQTSAVDPCPGPFNIEPCMSSEVAGIRGALAYLKADRSRVQPQLERTSYFGFSFGGIITANLANRYRQLALPKPRAVFLDDPHDGGLNGYDEPALDDSLAGIPSTTLFQCHSGAEGVMREANKANGSCNAVFPKLTSVPAKNKDLVLASPDDHGEPALVSWHGVCAARCGTDAYDWGFCWKVWDSLRSCANAKLNCRYALGDTAEHRHIGTWSDGVPVTGLKVQDVAPIRAQPVPDRPPAPKTRPATDRPPRARLTEIVRRGGRPASVRGTASDDHGLARVEVAVVRTSGGCRQLTPTGTFVALARCARPTAFLRARGTRRWSVRLSAALRPGAYRAFVLVTDSAGRQPPRAASRGFQAS